MRQITIPVLLALLGFLVLVALLPRMMVPEVETERMDTTAIGTLMPVELEALKSMVAEEWIARTAPSYYVEIGDPLPGIMSCSNVDQLLAVVRRLPYPYTRRTRPIVPLPEGISRWKYLDILSQMGEGGNVTLRVISPSGNGAFFFSMDAFEIVPGNSDFVGFTWSYYCSMEGKVVENKVTHSDLGEYRISSEIPGSFHFISNDRDMELFSVTGSDVGRRIALRIMSSNIFVALECIHPPILHGSGGCSPACTDGSGRLSASIIDVPGTVNVNAANFTGVGFMQQSCHSGIPQSRYARMLADFSSKEKDLDYVDITAQTTEGDQMRIYARSPSPLGMTEAVDIKGGAVKLYLLASEVAIDIGFIPSLHVWCDLHRTRSAIGGPVKFPHDTVHVSVEDKRVQNAGFPIHLSLDVSVFGGEEQYVMDGTGNQSYMGSGILLCNGNALGIGSVECRGFQGREDFLINSAMVCPLNFVMPRIEPSYQSLCSGLGVAAFFALLIWFASTAALSRHMRNSISK